MVNMVMMAQMMKSLVSRGPTRPRTVASSCMMVRDGATRLPLWGEMGQPI